MSSLTVYLCEGERGGGRGGREGGEGGERRREGGREGERGEGGRERDSVSIILQISIPKLK